MNYVILGALFAAVCGLIAFLFWDEKRRERAWSVRGEGVYDRAEYGYYVQSRRSGSMVHHTSYHRMDVTAVYFEDGRTCVLGGRHDMPYPKGTAIRIRANLNGRYRIEKL